MVKLTIDEREIEVDPDTTILQACERLGIEIPVFCYHPRLKIAGNCRMCLVEVEKSSKPIASCATPVAEGMVVRTGSPSVIQSRKGVLEFLLINHPLDCPICDEGGECDLQDLTLNYGPGNSRYKFYKRAVPDKYLGPFVKTIMNRCIHCMRCVRFITDVAGVPELGSKGRGEDTEIIGYLDRAMESELSGNIIDLCPVGALTGKPYAFQGRSWEFTHYKSIDVTDGLGSNLSLHVKNGEITRILPRTNESINEEWIADKARFFYDGLKCQRIDKPYVKVDGRLKARGWEEAFDVIKDKLSALEAPQVAAISGDLADQESQFALKTLLDSFGVENRDCRPYGVLIPYADRSQYLFNSTIQGIERSDAILLIGTNPRVEATILNARIRKAVVHNNARVALIGNEADLTYDYSFLGETPEALSSLLSGDHAFAKTLLKAENALVILGMDCFRRDDTEAILAAVNKLRVSYGVQVNVLHTSAACVGGMDVGLTPLSGGKTTAEIIAGANSGEIKFVYLLNADMNVGYGDAFVVYQGHHGDFGAHVADVVLPGLAFSEKSSTYVNAEGTGQTVEAAIAPPGEAREDWKIIKALATVLDRSLPFDTIEELRSLLPETLPRLPFVPFEVNPGAFSKTPFKPFIESYYMHDAISRHSKNMANAVAEIVEGRAGVI